MMDPDAPSPPPMPWPPLVSGINHGYSAEKLPGEVKGLLRLPHTQRKAHFRTATSLMTPSRVLTAISSDCTYIRTTGFTTKTVHRPKELGSLIQKSRETAARTGPNRMVGAFQTIQTMNVKALSGPRCCTQHCTAQACTHATNRHCMLGYSQLRAL